MKKGKTHINFQEDKIIFGKKWELSFTSTGHH